MCSIWAGWSGPLSSCTSWTPEMGSLEKCKPGTADSQAITRRTETPEWGENNVTVTPRKKSFSRCYWDQEALEKQHLSKNFTGLQQTQQLCSNKCSQGIGSIFICRKNRKGQIQLNLAVRLNHETAPGFHWGPGISGVLAEKQCSSLQLGLLEFWR